jgi:hypothetical protein
MQAYFHPLVVLTEQTPHSPNPRQGMGVRTSTCPSRFGESWLNKPENPTRSSREMSTARKSGQSRFSSNVLTWLTSTTDGSRFMISGDGMFSMKREIEALWVKALLTRVSSLVGDTL